jgi:hypothetical protein
MTTLTRLSLPQLLRQAEEVLEKSSARRAPVPDFGIPGGISFGRGGPGEPIPGDPPDPPRDYCNWCAGGPMPATVEGIDVWLVALKLDELV